MKTLSESQIMKQDFVDNTIYEMIQELNPSKKKIEWDIEMIGDIRDCLEEWFVNRLKITTAKKFYPYV